MKNEILKLYLENRNLMSDKERNVLLNAINKLYNPLIIYNNDKKNFKKL
jgi:hypothetical protein